MGRTLVICETRTRAEALARALGGRFDGGPTSLAGARLVLAWMAGEPATLAGPEVYDAAHASWELDSLPIVPARFVLTPRSDDDGAAQLREIRALVRRGTIDRLVNACEPGMEGELAFAYLRELAEADSLPVERVLLESLARPAIRRAFAQRVPVPEPDPAGDAARSRAEADWLVGVNGTRAATVRARALGGRVTIERVQTPLLAVLVAREREIEAFSPGTTYELVAAFESRSGSARYLARGHEGAEADPLDELASRVRGRAGLVRELGTRIEARLAPALIGLVELERQLATWHGFSARRTIDGALECYDAAVLTYPRATGRPFELEPAELREIALRVGQASAAYRDPAARVGELSPPPQPSLHVLVPTTGRHDLAALGDDARRVYDAVARRFLAAWLPPVLLEITTVCTEVEGISFRADGCVVGEQGWYGAYDDLPPEDAPDLRELPPLQDGEEVVCTRVERRARVSSPPQRFGDGTLVTALDELGLGTVAAHPSAIERLIGLGHVQRDGPHLRPTARGTQVIDLIGEHGIASPAGAGALERRLLAVERGAESREAVMAEVVARTRELVEHLRTLPDERTRFPRRDLGIVCPRCGDGTLIENRRGYGCSTWHSSEDPGCGFVIWKTIAGRPIDEAIVRELLAHGRTRELSGFRSRAGRPFRAHLILQPADDQPVTFAFGQPGATGRTRA